MQTFLCETFHILTQGLDDLSKAWMTTKNVFSGGM